MKFCPLSLQNIRRDSIKRKWNFHFNITSQLRVFSSLTKYSKLNKTNTSNMKMFIVLALFVACAVAVPLEEMRKAPIPIVRLNVESDNLGTYKIDSVSGDGTTVMESGSLKNLGDKEGPVSVSSGSYSFIGDDHKTYTVTWTADELGFRAAGEHLPTPPPLPQ